jgi:hypothetical protein
MVLNKETEKLLHKGLCKETEKLSHKGVNSLVYEVILLQTYSGVRIHMCKITHS